MLTAKERQISSWGLVIALLVGFGVPGVSEVFAPFTNLSLFFLIMLSLLPMGRMNAEDVFSLDTKVWQVVGWQLLVLPAIVAASAHLARLSPGITVLMVATASAGSLFASPALAELLQVNKRRAMQCMILSTFLMPFSYLLFFSVVLHIDMNINVLEFTHRCFILLVLPLGLFLVYMGVSLSLPERVTQTIESGSRRATIFALVIFGLGVMGPARDLLWNDLNRFLIYLAVVTILGAAMAYLTAIVMYRHGISDSLTASIVSGFRNTGLGFAVLSSIPHEGLDAYVGVSQVPVFLAPMIFGFILRKRSSAPELQAASA